MSTSLLTQMVHGLHNEHLTSGVENADKFYHGTVKQFSPIINQLFKIALIVLMKRVKHYFINVEITYFALLFFILHFGQDISVDHLPVFLIWISVRFLPSRGSDFCRKRQNKNVNREDTQGRYKGLN